MSYHSLSIFACNISFFSLGTVTNSDVGQFSNGRTFGNLADGQYAVQSDNHGNSNMITDFQQHYLMPGGYCMHC